jgi:hypothetical protein
MAEVAALRLLAVVVLPMVLFEIVGVPASTRTAMSGAETKFEVPFVVIEPMMLLEIAGAALVAYPMPKVVPLLPEVVTLIEPVPVPLPIVLPVMFAKPLCKKIPLHAPGNVEFVLEVVHTKFPTMLFCTLVGALGETFR